ncbi:hypothetical protein [Streptomyces sp. NPDC056491]|uniref:hypothetical protein n=1 Tax=Streptomyces sp. NPDC056491 TaxID=3345837 RepID=UPI0036B661D6
MAQGVGQRVQHGELIDPAKAGMAAGFLNTLRLGSEAITVAVYDSALATALGTRVDNGNGDHAGASQADLVAARAAGGDLARAAELSGAVGHRGLRPLPRPVLRQRLPHRPVGPRRGLRRAVRRDRRPAARRIRPRQPPCPRGKPTR